MTVRFAVSGAVMQAVCEEVGRAGPGCCSVRRGFGASALQTVCDQRSSSHSPLLCSCFVPAALGLWHLCLCVFSVIYRGRTNAVERGERVFSYVIWKEVLLGKKNTPISAFTVAVICCQRN